MGITRDTNIVTVYEGVKPLSELNKDTLIYTWNKDTKLAEVSMLRLPIESKEESVIEVEFDSGLKVRCTKEYEFYTFRGNRIQVQELKLLQSIRAFSMSIHKDGHLRVHGWVNGKAKHSYAARMIWEYFNGPVPKDMIIHHIDFVKLNNAIENFQLVTNSEHNSIHYPYRRDGGFFHKNHKVLSVKELDEKEIVYNCAVDNTHSFVLVDPTPVSGILSGIISLSL